MFNSFSCVPHSWKPDDILKAYNEDLVTGVDAAGTYTPLNNLMRAEACQMLYTAGLTWILNCIPINSMLGDFRPNK